MILALSLVLATGQQTPATLCLANPEGRYCSVDRTFARQEELPLFGD